MKSRYALGLFAAALTLALTVKVVQAAERHEHLKAGDRIEVVAGDWISGLHGPGVDWGEVKKGHTAITYAPLRPDSVVRAWKEGNHVVAIEIDGCEFRGKDAPEKLGDPQIDIHLKGDQGITFSLSENGPPYIFDIKGE